VPTKTDQRKQRYTKPTTHRRLSGTVGKRAGQGVQNTGVRYTGKNEDVSDGYSRIAEKRAPKPHGMLGDTNSHSVLHGTFSPTGLYTMRSLIQLGINNKDMELDSNNMGTNRINTTSTSRTIDNYTQLASSKDKDRHSNISSNSDNTGKNMIINRAIYIQVDCASVICRRTHFSRGHDTGNHQLIYLHPLNTNEISRQTDPLIDKGSQHHTVCCLNNIGNNRVNARSGSGIRDTNDMGSNKTISYNDNTILCVK
jgi:hypothetical protein